MNTKSRQAAVFVVLISLVTFLVIIVSGVQANAETPAERCTRETSTYNSAWAASWAASHPGNPGPVPAPPVPYVCVDPGTVPTATTAPPTTIQGLPTVQSPGGGPNVGANAPTNFPAYNGTPIVTVPPVPGVSVPTGEVPPSITLPSSPTPTSQSPSALPSASAPAEVVKSVIISTGSGTPLSLRIPFSDTVSEVDTSGPGRLFTGPDLEVATDSAGENTQVAVTLKTAAAPQSIPFTLDLPQGWVLRPRDGAVTEIFNGSGDREALLTTEKFTDATGELLPATQTVGGGTVTVHTDTSTQRYPYKLTTVAGKSGCSCNTGGTNTGNAGGTGPGSAAYERITPNPWYGKDPYLSNNSQRIADWTVAETFIQDTDNADGHRDRIRDVVRWSYENSAAAGESHDKAEDKAEAAAAAELDKIWAEEEQRKAAASATDEDWRREVAERTDWVDPNTLEDHYERHGGDFGAESEEDYAQQAQEFYGNKDILPTKYDSPAGKVRIYDPETNTLGVYTNDGKSISFYKPTGGQAHWDTQEGEYR
ncbi:hypothetical protein [Rhodococcus qingshengii]|uniref:hypothetical protein n=1 Tax=Rhodococcus qingshengii TaxID=334542 RepID=UPI0021BAEC66|nr:hypothetical protein [Rhodococcus qingshengii]UXF70028.1 hypothetical protein N6G92_13705 [Rhodococcus qingshengii]